MEKIMLFILFGTSALQALMRAQATHVFIHKSPNGDKIVFYLDRMPHIKKHTNKLTFDDMFLSTEQQKKLIKDHAPWYSLQVGVTSQNCVITIQKKHVPVTITFEQRTNIHQRATIGITIQKTRTTKINPPKTPLIAIDCGHGGHDVGAQTNDLLEKDLTLVLGKQLENMLHAHGYHTRMIRTNDRFIALDERTTDANMHHATLLVSLHINANDNRDQHGVTVFYENNASEKLAQAIYDALTTSTKKPVLYGNGVRQELAQVIYGTCMPAVIVELLFLSNPNDAQFLRTTQGQEILAKRVGHGIMNFLARQSAVAAPSASQDFATPLAPQDDQH